MGYFRHINLLKAFPGARMSGVYTVEKSTETKRGTSKAGFDYVVYDLVLDDGTPVEFSQSPSKPPPSVGQRIEGTISEQYGRMKLKPERIGQQQAASGTGAPLRDESTQKSIVRQHSQQMALMFCQSKAIVDKATDISIQLVKRLTDWFQQDAEGKDPGAFIP